MSIAGGYISVEVGIDMIKPSTFIVRPQDERPARRDGTCFYCREPIGSMHKEDCVIRRKTCVVDFTIRMVVSVPEDWDEEMINFRYNESSWCANNLLTYLENRADSTGRCMCDITSAKYIRDATEEDEACFGYDPSEDE